MAFNVVWSSFSEKQLDKIFEYYLDEAGEQVAKKVVKNLLERVECLKDHPELGPKEPYLTDLTLTYRYILYKSFKIIYRVEIDLNQIRVVDVFNCWQSPKKIKRGK